MRRGILLINLGTPNSPSVSGVRQYLREFLRDKRVVNLPAVLRYALVYGVIAPFRSRRSAIAYQSIWTDDGSPLLAYSKKLVQQLQEKLKSEDLVAIGMRYGSPSIKDALDSLKDCQSITVLPLYPQYSSAATGSSLEEVMTLLAGYEVIPSLHILRDFYQHPAYLHAQASLIKEHRAADEFLLFSYHGLPENQLVAAGCKTICREACPTPNHSNQACYKAQCEATSLLLAKALDIPSNQYSTSFQSRLGKTPWIKPYTDQMLVDLAAKGVKKLAVVCPSFVTDCLETLEEIGMQAQEQWAKLGGEQFRLIPAMNDNPVWISALVAIINEQHNY